MAILKRPPRFRPVSLAGVASLAAISLFAQEPIVLEHQVKAAYLVNFTRYVEWPAGSFPAESSPVVICVLGESPVLDALDLMVRGRSTHGRPLEVRSVTERAEEEDCHLLYVDYREWRRQPVATAGMARPGMLTVGETPEFVEEGGVISFVPVDDHIRFAVNLGAGSAASLRLSSRMLALATRIYNDSADSE